MKSSLEQDQANIRQGWEAFGDDIQTIAQDTAEHLRDAALAEKIASIITAAPDSILGGPIPLGTVVNVHNGLPLNRRTVEEIMDDYETQAAFEASYQRSVERRSPPKHESGVVVSCLDTYDALVQVSAQRVGPAVTSSIDYQLLGSDLGH